MIQSTLRTLFVGMLILTVKPVSADYYYVLNTGDSGPGTLRQAIIDANAHAGADMIIFEIDPVGTGKSIAPLSALPTITSPVEVNGWSQGGLGYDGPPLIELNGTSAGGSVNGLNIAAGQSTVTGLIINRFGGVGINLDTNGNNYIRGCYLGTNWAGTAAQGNGHSGVRIYDTSDNTIGWTYEAARNVISGNTWYGIDIVGSTSGTNNNRILGNYIGTDVTGSYAIGNGHDGIDISGSPYNVIGGTVEGAGNVISGNGDDAIQLSGTLCADTQILGNLIGTNASGTSAVPNNYGIYIYGAIGTFVGGSSAAERNVISGNNYNGVLIADEFASGNRITGNFIGLDVTGSYGIGNRHGVVIGSAASGNTIGGVSESLGNRIAYNTDSGIIVSSGTGNWISRNSIFSNGTLGIDLNEDGVTPNDNQDPDTGPNNLQNRPLLTSVVSGGGSTTIQGTFNSTPNRDFTIEFFSNATPDPTNYGEGETYLGSTLVHTDPTTGSVTFNVTLPSVTVPGGYYVSATATDETTNDTSEFSQVEYVVNTNMVLTGVQVGSTLQLSWTSVSGVSAYWVYGASNLPWFAPGLTSPFAYRLAVLGSGITTWSSSNGIGNPSSNWTYLVLAVNGSGGELSRSNRAGEFDFDLSIP